MQNAEEFARQCAEEIANQQKDEHFRKATQEWMLASFPHRYTYHFRWLGLPILQFPQDVVALQEVIWDTQPDVIVETGIARGGSQVFFASMLRLLGNDGLSVGVDIEIRPENRKFLQAHPMGRSIRLVEGSSTDPTTRDKIVAACEGRKRLMLVLDSDHTHEHVLAELNLLAPLVAAGCYLVVLDTSIEDAPEELFVGKRWSKGNNPKSAVHEFLRSTDRFEIDRELHSKLMITVAPDGYLRCLKDG